MEIVRPTKPGIGIYAKSVPAEYKDRHLADEMVEFMDGMAETWDKENQKMCYALAHSQVTDSTEPRKIFVVHNMFVDTKESATNTRFPDRRIFNAQVVEIAEDIKMVKPVRKTVMNEKTGRREIKLVDTEVTAPNELEAKEGCMTWPEKTTKLVLRPFRIKVAYEIPRGSHGMKKCVEWVEGLKARIFMHEVDHFNGQNIYYKTPPSS